MQIEKALINDQICDSKVSWKFYIPTVYDFAVIYLWVANFLTVSIVLYFLFVNKTLWLNNLKIRAVMIVKILVFVICVKMIIYLLLNNLHDCTCNQSLFFSMEIFVTFNIIFLKFVESCMNLQHSKVQLLPFYYYLTRD